MKAYRIENEQGRGLFSARLNGLPIYKELSFHKKLVKLHSKYRIATDYSSFKEGKHFCAFTEEAFRVFIKKGWEKELYNKGFRIYELELNTTNWHWDTVIVLQKGIQVFYPLDKVCKKTECTLL
jgi:hypothetical protein